MGARGGGGREQRFKGAEAAGAAARPRRTAGRGGGGSGDMCGGRGGIWLVLAAALLHGNRSAASAVLPAAGSGEQVRGADRRAGERAGGPGLRPGGGAELLRGWMAAPLRPRWALCFPSVPARRVPEEAVQGAGQELQPAGEAGGQRLAAAHSVLLPEPPADHGCGESSAALGPHTLLSGTRLRFRQDPQPPVHGYFGSHLSFS